MVGSSPEPTGYREEAPGVRRTVVLRKVTAMSDDARKDSAAGKQGEPKDAPAGSAMKDPTDTDHPTGSKQAEENAATESPS